MVGNAINAKRRKVANILMIMLRCRCVRWQSEFQDEKVEVSSIPVQILVINRRSMLTGSDTRHVRPIGNCWLDDGTLAVQSVHNKVCLSKAKPCVIKAELSYDVTWFHFHFVTGIWKGSTWVLHRSGEINWRKDLPRTYIKTWRHDKWRRQLLHERTSQGSPATRRVLGDRSPESLDCRRKMS